jgi:hypothetical protein
MFDVETLLKWQTAGYDALYERARRWRLSGQPIEQEHAEKLLTGLRAKYPLALEIGQELVLALADRGKWGEAQDVLNQLDQQLRNPNEELLCRWGRIFKEEGDVFNSHLPKVFRQSRPEDARAANDQQADACYGQALTQYDLAYRIRFGHYPGVNKAALLLVRAALAAVMQDEARSEASRAAAEEMARDLLKRRASWPDDQPDDRTVWHPATEAEARLLVREWETAAELYRSIQAAPKQRDTMRQQVRRILAAWDLLNVTQRGPCSTAEAVLPG